jgi:hypothetical protein
MHPTEKTRSFFVGESHDDPLFEAMVLLLFMRVKRGLFFATQPMDEPGLISCGNECFTLLDASQKGLIQAAKR